MNEEQSEQAAQELVNTMGEGVSLEQYVSNLQAAESIIEASLSAAYDDLRRAAAAQS